METVIPSSGRGAAPLPSGSADPQSRLHRVPTVRSVTEDACAFTLQVAGELKLLFHQRGWLVGSSGECLLQVGDLGMM